MRDFYFSGKWRDRHVYSFNRRLAHFMSMHMKLFIVSQRPGLTWLFLGMLPLLHKVGTCIWKKCMKVRQKLGTRKLQKIKFKIQKLKFKMLMLILGTCQTTFVFMSMLKSDIYQMSSVKCQMLMLILGTWWTTFVFMSKLKSDIYQMSSVKCLCWSS